MIKRLSTSILLLLTLGCWEASAQDTAWRVGKSSGEVVISGANGAQQTSLSSETALAPGDYVRTGQTGRVLLVRGDESMLVSPNSVIQIPKENRDGMSTTIVQRAGTILFEVEKRNVKHFQVDTPYLAAVVKGTQFEVSVERAEARVDVRRGQVEVRDYKSGQYALVNPEQTAKVAAQGPSGLALSGSGTLSPVQQGAPRRSPVQALDPSEERMAANGAPQPAQPSAAAPAIDSSAILTPAKPSTSLLTRSDSASATKSDSWMGRVMPNASPLDPRTWKVRAGDTDFDLGIPFAAGIFVAFAVAVKRGWQKRRKKSS